MSMCLPVCMSVYLSVCSMAVHPDRVTIATGQVAGHDKHEGKVCDTVSRLFSANHLCMTHAGMHLWEIR